MTSVFYQITFILVITHPTTQNCPREISPGKIHVIWPETPTAENVESKPQCYINETLLTRSCIDTKWTPSLDELTPCTTIMKYRDHTSCPPGYNSIGESNGTYCYQIGEPVPWDFPCYANGGSSAITDLSPAEIAYLFNALQATNISRYFWLPAQKRNLFNPLVWKIPGPHWGKRVTSSEHLRLYELMFKNCLLLDIEDRVIVTDHCSKSHYTFCFYINNFHYPAQCPTGYHSFRFTSENDACYGIARPNTSQRLPFYDFLRDGSCFEPMSTDESFYGFIYQKIAEIDKIPNNQWCWIKTHEKTLTRDSHYSYIQRVEGIINNVGVIGSMNTNFSLTCMACKTEVVHKETELMFEYDYEQNLIYLTIYHPSGLWKYSDDDIGIQCFSDADGFVNVIDINDNPFIKKETLQQDVELGEVEKVVYVVDLVTDSSAQYWCEGHTYNFSFISTEKVIVNPKGNKIHVFALVIKYHILPGEFENATDLSTLVANITEMFKAKKVLLMDILYFTLEYLYILLHLHITIDDVYDDVALNVQETFNNLTSISESQLANYNYTFVNLSSSIYCLPTFSLDAIKLEWELTPIGHIAAPKQFCLQSNGLPVKRRCEGSYKLGATWGAVEGWCDNNYEPSTTTTFLYSFLKLSRSWPIFQFLTEGLNFVLGDPEIIIPADIYYLAMSLQQISDIAQENSTSLDTTDIEDLAWIMDRIMVLDCEYLRLSQTLNSTNVIVDSISEIIEITVQKNLNETGDISNIAHQLVVQPQFIVQITHPDYNNITGIAIVNNTSSDKFTDTLIYPLYKNNTLEEILSIENLEIATWIPKNVLDSIHMYNNSDGTNNDLHVIITIYHNDAVFQELQNYNHAINSRIIGVSMPGYISNLEYPIPILFKQINNTTSPFCAYWDFKHQDVNHIPGSWKREGCFLVKSLNNITVCECYHLTHFGQLFFNNAVDDNIFITKAHSVALNVITLVGCFLSLFGIVGIWITALVFSNWRKKAGTKILLQLSTAIALPLVFILVFNLDYSMFILSNDTYVIDKSVRCIILGALLHFSILASFMWMLITAVLQFIRYVRVLGVRRPARFMFKFTLIGWGIPLLPVIITLVLDSSTYIPAPSKIRRICYPSGNYLIAASIVPICVILIVNIALFISVLYAISRKSDVKMKNTDMDLVGAQLRVSIFLFFLLGLTWVFGIFSISTYLIWSYLFCLTSTVQGFVLFIYFIICDPNTRGLWVTLMTPHFTTHSSRNSVTSLSAGSY